MRAVVPFCHSKQGRSREQESRSDQRKEGPPCWCLDVLYPPRIVILLLMIESALSSGFLLGSALFRPNSCSRHVLNDCCHLHIEKSIAAVLLPNLWAILEFVFTGMQSGAKVTAGKLQGDDKWHIFCTGHSMGGALANLCAHELAVSPVLRRT